jgi:hypothetical protein
MQVIGENACPAKDYTQKDIGINTYLNGNRCRIACICSFFTVYNTVIFWGKYRLNTGLLLFHHFNGA